MAELDNIGDVCQSCSMPLEEGKDHGTNADGSRHKQYCHFCFQKGKFTEPRITMEQMIEKVVGIMMLEKVMDEREVRRIAGVIIPALERWSKKA